MWISKKKKKEKKSSFIFIMHFCTEKKWKKEEKIHPDLNILYTGNTGYNGSHWKLSDLKG